MDRQAHDRAAAARPVEGLEYRLAVEGIADAIFVIRRFRKAWRYGLVNPAFTRLTGKSADDVRGATCPEVFGERVGAIFEAQAALAAHSGHPVRYEQDGTRFSFQISLTPVVDRRGRCLRIIGVVRDIMALRAAQDALRRSEANQRAVIDGAADAITALDLAPDGQYRFSVVNTAFEAMGGMSREALLGRSPADLYPEPVARFIEGRHAEAVTAGTPIAYEVEDRGRHLVGHLTPLFDAAGVCYRLVTVTRDTTAQRRVEEALRRSEVNQRAILDGAPDPIVALDLGDDGLYRFTHVNRAFEALVGIPAAEALGRTVFDIFPLPVAQALQHRKDEAIAAGGPIGYELEGPRNTVLARMTPLFDGDGRCYRLVSVLRDVTEQRRAEAALRRVEEQRAALWDTAPDAIIALDRDAAGDYRFALVNAVFAARLGRPRDDIVGKTPEELLDPSVAGAVYEMRRAAQETGQTVSRVVEAPRGTFFVRMAPVFDEAGELYRLVAVVQDVSGERAAEEAARRSEAELRDLIEALPEPICALDLAEDGAYRFTHMNREWERLTGLSRAEAFGRTLFDLFPADAAVMAARHAEAIATRKSLTFERALHGRTLLSRITPIFDEAGRCRRLVSIGSDVTEQRLAEERLRQADKTESLAVVAAGMAHDFNNILATISGNAGIVGLLTAVDGEAAECLDEIVAASNRAAELVRRLREYAGIDRNPVSQLDVNTVLRESANRFRGALVELVPGLPETIANAAQLRQVVDVFVANAREAGGGDSLAIRCSLQHVDADYLAKWYVPAAVPEGDYVAIEVEDAGSGMDAPTLQRVFDPFFTTKFTGRGLGLPAALGIARSNGGTIAAWSRPGVGARFTLLLPPAHAA